MPDATPSPAAAGAGLRVGIDERLPWQSCVIFALQQLLVDVPILLIPVVIGAALKLPPSKTATIVQATLLGAGVVTILQALWRLRLPVIQGPGIVFVALVATVGATYGIAAVWTAMAIAGAICFVLALPPLRLWGRIRPALTAPQVYGCWMILVVLAVAQSAIGTQIIGEGTSRFGHVSNIVLALIPFVLVIVLTIGIRHPTVKSASFLIAGIAGCAVAALTGQMHLTSVADAKWFGAPDWFPFGFDFKWSAVLIIGLGYILNIAESMGVYQLIGTQFLDSPLDSDRMNDGIMSEALGSALSGAFGGAGTVTFTQNVGTISTTGVASRLVFATSGAILVVLGFIPKFAAFVADLPGPVTGALLLLAIGLIGYHGVRAAASVKPNDLNKLIIAVGLGVGGGCFFLPAPYLATLPAVPRAFLSNGLAVGLVLPLVIFVIGHLWLRLDEREATETLPEDRGFDGAAAPLPTALSANPPGS